MNNILVVGGAGYIGSHTVKLLKNKGYNCIVFDNLSYGHRESLDSDIKFIKGDLLDKESVNEVFNNNSISSVIHFAAYAYVGESVKDPNKYYQNNVVGTLNLLDTMLKTNVKDIVFSSTCATYGNPVYTPIDEQHPQNPINPYGKTKLMIEQVLEDYKNAYGFNYISLRYFNAAGCDPEGKIGESHEPETHLIPIILKAIKGEIPVIKIYGSDYDTPDGTCIRDYIHVEDLANAHFLALTKLREFNGHLNLGTGIGKSVKEILISAEGVTEKSCPKEYVNRRPGDPSKLLANNTKAKQVLGWEPKYLKTEDIVQTAWKWEMNRRY